MATQAFRPAAEFVDRNRYPQMGKQNRDYEVFLTKRMAAQDLHEQQ